MRDFSVDSGGGIWYDTGVGNRILIFFEGNEDAKIEMVSYGDSHVAVFGRRISGRAWAYRREGGV